MVEVIFVCWGNICRSPMAERVAQAKARDFDVPVQFTSAGVSSEEGGHGIDFRARRVLEAAGYDADNHRAHRITDEEIETADLVVCAEPMHIDMLRRRVPDAQNLRLLNDYNPDLAKGTKLIDPWYGDAEGFNDTLYYIEAAMDGLFAEIADLDTTR